MDELRLDSGRFERLINAPESIRKRVVIDEIQKFPRLLDIVHQQIQKTKRQFIMTGSSSRKLKQAGTNLLAGRAWVYALYPFTSEEIGETFDLKRALERGSLPDAYLPTNFMDAKEYLSAYVATYLEKEIQQEQWVKNLEPFRRFLAVAAQMNGQILNYSSLSRDVGVNDVTVANYFEILEDTLLGFHLPAYDRSVRRAQKKASKFYFIDPGIKRALDKTLSVELLPQTSDWGNAFEHWLILEIFKNISYQRKDWKLSYLRTKNNLEIDLIIERPGKALILIEIKSKQKVSEIDAKSLESLGPSIDQKSKRLLLSLDPLPAQFGGTTALPWQKGLKEIGL